MSPSQWPMGTRSAPERRRRSFQAAITGFARGAWGRLRRHGASLALAATAASVSYSIATLLLGSVNAVFAPIAAVITVGLAAGQRLRRAAEIALGVMLGLAAAVGLSFIVGTGPIQLALFVLLAMGAAVAFGRSDLMANQAAVAAVLVVGFANTVQWNPLARMLDALIGVLTALLLHAVLSPDPIRALRGAVGAVIDRLARSIELSADAATNNRPTAAAEALAVLDPLPAMLTDIDDELAAARERARMGFGRSSREPVRRAIQLRKAAPLLGGTAQAVARAASNAIRHGGTVPSTVQTGLNELNTAVRLLAPWVDGDVDASAPVDAALKAAQTAAATPRLQRVQTTSVLIGQLRSCAVDLLRACGMNHSEAIARLEAAAGRADETP